MVKSPELMIYTEGHAKIGMGHIFRTLALADYLRGLYEIRFIVPNLSEGAKEVIEAQGFDCHVLPPFREKQEAIEQLKTALDDASAVVSDSYGFDTDFQRAIREARKLACIDDIHAFPFACDLILNHSPHAQAHHYQTLGPPPRFCLGLDFALLRNEFLQEHMESASADKSIVICMGGTDHKRVGLQLLELLAQSELPFTRAIYITTSANPFCEEVRSTCARLAQKYPSKVFAMELDLGAHQMRQIIQDTCLMICAPSTIALEGIACRTPLMTLTTADNQYDLAEALSQKGATVNLGTSEDFSKPSLLRQLRAFLHDSTFSQTMKMRQSQLIDLQSNQRIISEFSKLFGQG